VVSANAEEPRSYSSLDGRSRLARGATAFIRLSGTAILRASDNACSFTLAYITGETGPSRADAARAGLFYPPGAFGARAKPRSGRHSRLTTCPGFYRAARESPVRTPWWAPSSRTGLPRGRALMNELRRDRCRPRSVGVSALARTRARSYTSCLASLRCDPPAGTESASHRTRHRRPARANWAWRLRSSPRSCGVPARLIYIACVPPNRSWPTSSRCPPPAVSPVLPRRLLHVPAYGAHVETLAFFRSTLVGRALDCFRIIAAAGNPGLSTSRRRSPPCSSVGRRLSVAES